MRLRDFSRLGLDGVNEASTLRHDAMLRLRLEMILFSVGFAAKFFA